MSDPLVTPDDLAVYLSDERIDEDRAAMMIADAQALCETIVSPLPASAALVVKRVAARAYVSTLTARQAQQQAAGGMFSGVTGGGVRLYPDDRAVLRSMGGISGGAFGISVLPTGYVAPGSRYAVDGLMGGWDVIP